MLEALLDPGNMQVGKAQSRPSSSIWGKTRKQILVLVPLARSQVFHPTCEDHQQRTSLPLLPAQDWPLLAQHHLPIEHPIYIHELHGRTPKEERAQLTKRNLNWSFKDDGYLRRELEKEAQREKAPCLEVGKSIICSGGARRL